MNNKMFSVWLHETVAPSVGEANNLTSFPLVTPQIPIEKGRWTPLESLNKITVHQHYPASSCFVIQSKGEVHTQLNWVTTRNRFLIGMTWSGWVTKHQPNWGDKDNIHVVVSASDEWPGRSNSKGQRFLSWTSRHSIIHPSRPWGIS